MKIHYVLFWDDLRVKQVFREATLRHTCIYKLCTSFHVLVRFRETSPCIKGVNWEPMPWSDFQMTITRDLNW